MKRPGVRIPIPPPISPRTIPTRRGCFALAKEIVRDKPIVLSQINWNDWPVKARPGEPVDETVIEVPVRVDNKESASTFRPITDVLTNQVLQELRFPRAGPTTNI